MATFPRRTSVTLIATILALLAESALVAADTITYRFSGLVTRNAGSLTQPFDVGEEIVATVRIPFDAPDLNPDPDVATFDTTDPGPATGTIGSIQSVGDVLLGSSNATSFSAALFGFEKFRLLGQMIRFDIFGVTPHISRSALPRRIDGFSSASFEGSFVRFIDVRKICPPDCDVPTASFSGVVTAVEVDLFRTPTPEPAVVLLMCVAVPIAFLLHRSQTRHS